MSILTGTGVSRRRHRPIGTALKALSLSNSTVMENSAVSTIIGYLQNTTPGSALTLVDTAGGLFGISGGNIVVNGVIDYETASYRTITVRETLSGATGSPRDTVLTINVVNVAAPSVSGSISDQTFTQNTPITPINVTSAFIVPAGSGTTTYALAPSSAALPAGLTLSSAGILSGTPTTTASAISIVVRCTTAEGYVDQAFSLTVNATGDNIPPEISSLTVGVQSGATIPASFTITEAATVSWVLTLAATQCTPTQVATGKNASDAPAAASGSFAVLASGDYNITLPAGLNNNYYLQLSPIDGSGNRSTDVDVYGPIAINTVIGATEGFIGNAVNTTYATSHTLNSTKPGTVQLPASFQSGKYLIIVHTGGYVPSSVIFDGNNITSGLFASQVTAGMTIHAYEATIAGGGTGNIVVSVPTADPCAVEVYCVGTRSRVDHRISNRTPSTATIPVGTDGTTPLTVLAGDMAISAIQTVSTTSTSDWVNLTSTVPPTLLLSNRYLLSAWSQNCPAGAPPTLTANLGATFKQTTAFCVQYR